MRRRGLERYDRGCGRGYDGYDDDDDSVLVIDLHLLSTYWTVYT